MSYIPILIVFAIFACILLFRISYAFIVFLFTGKLYDESSSWSCSSHTNAVNWKLLLLGKNFKFTILECILFPSLISVLYFSGTGIFLMLYVIGSLLYPYSLWITVIFSVVVLLVCTSHVVRSRKAKKSHFVCTLSGTEDVPLYRVVSEGEE